MRHDDRYEDRIKAGIDAILAAYGKPASEPELNPKIDRGPARPGEITIAEFREWQANNPGIVDTEEDFYILRTINRAGLL